METKSNETLTKDPASSAGSKDAKQTNEASSSSSNGTGAKETTKYDPLAIATRIAEQTPGGEDEQVGDGTNEKEETQEKGDASGDVLKKNETGEEAEKPVGDEQTQTGEKEKKEDEEKEKKEDDVQLDEKANDEDTRFNKHPRFQKLLAENKELKPLAESAKAVNGYCDQHGITPQQFNSALEMAALMNVDPLRAREAMRPYWESLESYAGERLPQDLQKRLRKESSPPKTLKNGRRHVNNLLLVRGRLRHSPKHKRKRQTRRRCKHGRRMSKRRTLFMIGCFLW